MCSNFEEGSCRNINKNVFLIRLRIGEFKHALTKQQNVLGTI